MKLVEDFGLSMTRGLPESITVDNRPEFAGMALDRWAYAKNVKLAFIRPGKPVENAFIESFNGRVRQEWWRIGYNGFRPHRSLNGLTPEDFAKQWRAKNDVNSTPQLSQEPVQTKG